MHQLICKRTTLIQLPAVSVVLNFFRCDAVWTVDGTIQWLLSGRPVAIVSLIVIIIVKLLYMELMKLASVCFCCHLDFRVKYV